MLEDQSIDLIGWYMLELCQRYELLHPEADINLTNGDGQSDSSMDSNYEHSYGHTFVGCLWVSDNPYVGSSNATADDEDDCPDLVSVSDELDDDYRERVADQPVEADHNLRETTELIKQRVQDILTRCQPFPGDSHPIDPTYTQEPRFIVEPCNHDLFQIYDCVQGFEAHLHLSHLRNPDLFLGKWFAKQCASNQGMPHPWEVAQSWANSYPWGYTIQSMLVLNERLSSSVELGGIQVD